MRGLVIVSVLCLAAGVALIFGYCNGTTGLQFGFPVATSDLHMNLVTKGWPALFGVALTAAGLFLQIVAFFAALSGAIWSRSKTTPRRREEPFDE